MFSGILRRCRGACRCLYHRPGSYQAQQGNAIIQQLDGIAWADVSPQQDGSRGFRIPTVNPGTSRRRSGRVKTSGEIPWNNHRLQIDLF